jgi:tetratricopeptide (TPR) repeat protein
MKALIIAAAALCLVMAGGIVLYMNFPRHAAPPVAVAAAEVAPPEAAPAPDIVPTAKPVAPQIVTKRKIDPAASVETPEAALNRMIDTLASPKTSFEDRRALWQQLKAAGQLDLAIAELKQRAAANPNDAETPALLGQAYLHKFPVPDYNESAMLGLQADQSFNAALKIDPANWDAQFFKADAMSYWPVEMNKGPEVIQRLSDLITQQDSMPPQSDFAQTYLVLGEQYQKAGQTDAALQIWQKGLALYPNNVALQVKFPRP